MVLAYAHDVAVIGAGPNGLAAAIELARSGLKTVLVEASDTAGGGARTQELTLPGFKHDVCSTVHPLGLASPFFRQLNLEQYGVEWLHSATPLAHVVGPGDVVTLERSIAATADQLGRDGKAYSRLFEPLVTHFDELLADILGPLRVPRKPLQMARFGLLGLQSLNGLATRFKQPRASALLAGMAAHAMLPLEDWATASFALVLGMSGHAVGWPVVRGGSGHITEALKRCFEAYGGEVVLNRRITQTNDLPPARAYVYDVTPRQLLAIFGDELPQSYRRRIAKYRYGPGVFKMDWALTGPIPWSDSGCRRATTIHLSGELHEVAAAERAVYGQIPAQRPFVLVVQPTVADSSRAPEGRHVAWAYCHVPSGSTEDYTAAIEQHIELYAPGFRRIILGRASKNAKQIEGYNPNYVGGDINGGQASLSQLFFRPIMSIDPYATGLPNVFLCSSSTPPGGGVHGMCGYFAAHSVLKNRARWDTRVSV